ncbi:substrate-binding domain-containing protein [Treponema brennaborense]|uniref:Periplasmic binding protein/LacI transcriptional regulator n=1 Tax=Treponema brennaborense (strain DSM 12168 / CIP 105900 / DD5/3) TaxID=906968 RepID=F4LK17_TREBD|nr:substrate-binding domain-containing protein [Treponema brennaborense]AEE17479.1 periplasmic binding protein/LacI transcriptional regulator [Treponema brennaborense DSM 12168]
MKKALFVAAALMVSGATLFAGGTKDSGKKKVFLITMDQMDQHWVQVDAGAQAAVKELGNIQYKWLAPDVKDDAKQIECVNNAVAAGADCILLAANGPDAVTSALKEAAAAGVKIVYVDSAADFPGEQLLATDNRAGGRQVGETLIKDLASKGVAKGMIGIIGVNAATESCNQREFGFRDAFEGTAFTLLETQYCQGDAAVAKDMAANFITQGCVAVYGANEGSTVGVGNAVKEAAGKNVVGCGSDASDMNKSLVKNGALLCIMAQNPYRMGYEGVKSAAKVLAGEKVSPSYFDTGVSIITKSDL